MDPNDTEVASQVEAPQADAPQAGEPDTTEISRLQKEIADLRKENAKHRTANKEAERRAAEETGQFKTLYEQSTAELEQLRGEIARRDRETLLTKVASKHGLPDDLRPFITATDEAGMEEQAKTLAKRIAPAPPSTGATNPGRGTDAPRSAPKHRGIRGIGD
jgi:alanyl-tRNA synthetase